MKDIFLIPGSMMAAPSPLKPDELVKAQEVNGGFYSFDKEIRNGEIGLFLWHDNYPESFKVNPLSPLLAYANDRKRVSTSTLQHDLIEALAIAQPRVIVTHSKGCQLVLESFARFGLPLSVKKVVFMQSDADLSDDLAKLADTVELINLYAKDDATLWSSVVLNGGKIRAGLMPSKQSGVINKPYSSKGIHISTLKDPEIKNWILSL